MSATLSRFAESLSVETAFSVLSVAKQLIHDGKDVIELEIGDSPFESSPSAKAGAIDSIGANNARYCPSPGIVEFRVAAAKMLSNEFKIPVAPVNIVAGPGAKVFELFFCEAFLNPDDDALVFSPYFPTYLPNIERRQANITFSSLTQENAFRPKLDEVEAFINNADSPKAIFLNTPHNPTGGVATEEDLANLADLIRGKDIAVFSDEPYCHMVWDGRHHSILEQPGMLEQCVAAYTMSKSYSMSGWRLGFAATGERIATAIGKMVNTSLSCTPPFVQTAGARALNFDSSVRDKNMTSFREKVELLACGLNEIDGFHTLAPTATFYAFPNVMPVCNRLNITSHGLAMYLLEGADDKFGVACLGGECFGDAGHGFLRFSCAEPNERLQAAIDFIPMAISRVERIDAYLETNPHFKLTKPYPEP